MRADTLHALLEATGLRRAVILATRLSDGEQSLLFGDELEDSGEGASWPLASARQALREDRALVHGTGADAILLRPYSPPLRLFVVGAVHVAQPLVSIGAALGLEVMVIDPREAFATPSRFPGVTVVRDWPDRVVREQGLDSRSALVALTHDPKIDDPALAAALETPAFYIGALGSRTTHQKRLEALRARGVSDRDAARIRGPVGLDIGARSPGEIAVAIAAELIQHLRRPG